MRCRGMTLMLMLLLAAGVLLPPAPAVALPPAAGEAGVEPLPLGCGGVTPPGVPLLACCLSGLVYLDGQPVAGAEVQVQNGRGDQVTVLSQRYGGETRPHYRLGLSAAPLDVAVGDTITVTARYSGHQRSLRHQVQPGGQQVDLVLAHDQAEDYVYHGRLWGQAEPGQFNLPHGIAIDSAGDIYVVDGNNARVQVFNRSRALVRQWGTLGNGAGQFSAPGGIAVDSSDNVYVADQGNHRVHKFSRSGSLLMVVGGFGSADGQFDGPEAVAIDPAGNLYVADRHNHRVQKFRSDGQWLQSWGGYGQAHGQFIEPDGIAVDQHGHVYVAEFGDPAVQKARIQKFRDNGEWLQSWGGLGSGPDQLDRPHGLAVDGQGNLYVADSYNHRVQKFSPDGAHLETIGGLGTAAGQFNLPKGVSIDRAGNLYVADRYNFRIQRRVGDRWEIWGSEGRANGQFDSPYGLGVDRHGTLFVADTWNNRIQAFQGDQHQHTWGSRGVGHDQFDTPFDVAADSAGRVFVADRKNRRIQRRDLDGSWNTWGATNVLTGTFSPTGLAIDAADNVYVADTAGHRVVKLDGAGNIVQSWTGASVGAGAFSRPYGVAVDGGGNVYVADTYNKRIVKLSPAGALLAVWSGGSGANYPFARPYGLAIDRADNLYVADPDNYRIHKISGSGVVLASWGVQGSGDGQFRCKCFAGATFTGSPSDVAVDGDGIVYAADVGNNRIQRFRASSATRPIATIAHLSAASLAEGDTLTAYGVGQPSIASRTISSYRWRANGQLLGQAPTLVSPAAALGPGSHTLTLDVQDSAGQWSEPVGVPVYVAAPNQAEWTMLLYLAGDYHDRGSLLHSFSRSLDRLRRQLANPRVRIAAQVDGPAGGDTRRLLIVPGASGAAPQVTELPYAEQAMDDPATLADFVRWGQSSFPAARYYLAIANHGQGVQGTAWDSTSAAGDTAFLTVAELGQALNSPQVAPIDVLHLDACSMGLLEVAYEVRQRVRVVIASQYLGWSYFAYDDYAAAASGAPDDFARSIVERYAARAAADHYPATIAALDLRRIEPLQAAVDALAVELAALVDNDPNRRAALDNLWLASQRFESNGNYVEDDHDVYLDLADWADRVRAAALSPSVERRAATLLAELTGASGFVLASAAHSNALPPQYGDGAQVDLAGAQGLSVFYPRQKNGVLFDQYVNDELFSFTGVSSWPDFLIAGVGPLPPGPPAPPPGPLAPLAPPPRVFLPLALR